MVAVIRALIGCVVALALVACSDGGNGSATPTPTTASPSATADAASGGPVCEYLRDVVATTVANAEARVDLNEVFDQLGDIQGQLQEFGVDLIGRNQTEPFGRAVLEVNASVAKVRIGITTQDPDQISAFANEVRADLAREEIVERCGEIATGVA